MEAEDRKDMEEPMHLDEVGIPDNENTNTKEIEDDTTKNHLSTTQTWNLVFCVLAWACTIANVTLVVGTSNVVFLSIQGNNPSLSTVPLAAFFLGASLVSLLVTPWHFQRYGRKTGFLVGVGLGLGGTVLGILSIFYQVPNLLIVATVFFGAAMGIGFYLRFAAVEVVPKTWADKAVTLVVSGGCIAAFAGPESAEGTRGIFGHEYEFLGVFVMTGVFNLANGVFTYLVQFPAQAIDQPQEEPTSYSSKWVSSQNIIQKRHFTIPVLLAAGSWIIMALPMSVLRVAMHQVGFTSRQSLLTIELHFLGMYAPGFFSGQWIAKFGPRFVSIGAVSIFLIAFACLQLAKENDESSDIFLWIFGMILIGIGWNFGFTSSTVGSTRSYTSQPKCRSVIQAANDGLTFLIAGAVICCASFIYQAGGEELEGWWTVNWAVLGFMGMFAFVLVIDVVLERKEVGVSANDKWSTPSNESKE